ncbi:MAG TPA: hypothetical protein VF450_02890 [Noviherbaspirillum sp.]
MSRRRLNFKALLGDELPPEYYERAVAQLMLDENEQRDFVQSEFLDLASIRAMIGGKLPPDDLQRILSAQFAGWLREHRKFRVTTMAWALYAQDHPNARRV